MTETREKRPKTRARLIAAAIDLFQARGYHGAGLAEILERADAPKGSLYHHFPGGKAELAVAAIERVAEDAFTLRRRETPPRAARFYLSLAENTAAWMKLHDYRMSPLITTLATTAFEPAIEAAARAAHAKARATLAGLLAAEGRAEPAALAEFALAAFEGGILLARIRRDRAPLLEAARRAAAVLDGPDQRFS